MDINSCHGMSTVQIYLNINPSYSATDNAEVAIDDGSMHA